MKVVTYSRVSTSNKDQNPQVQVEELRRYCAARGWTIEHEVVDHGYSGSTEARPGLKKLLTLVRERQVDLVVVVKMDRLFRSLKHLITTLEDWQALGIQFVATKDNVDYTTPAGRLFVQVLGSLAEFEKALIRERTMMGLAHARASGVKLGRPRVEVDERIFAMHKLGSSIRKIEATLNISRSSIARILQLRTSSVRAESIDRGEPLL